VPGKGVCSESLLLRVGWVTSRVLRHCCLDGKTERLHYMPRATQKWMETDMIKNCSAIYCELKPPPRSTIAATFSPDGKFLASTHGDHTVKLICCRTGRCLKVMSGHRRTPWAVRFHPRTSHILASGSLDYEVRIWNVSSGECITSWDFARPIASLAFHALGDVIAIASGHNLKIWDYSRMQDSKPVTILRTKRSLRAVHFHPLGVPLLLSAEVNDQDSTQDLPQAHCTGRWREALSDYSRNTVFDEGSLQDDSMQGGADPAPQLGGSVSAYPVSGYTYVAAQQDPQPNLAPSSEADQRSSGNLSDRDENGPSARTSREAGARNNSNNPPTNRRWEGLSGIFRNNFPAPPAQGANNNQRTESNTAATAASAAPMAQDLPCTVRLRLWPFDIANPKAPLEDGKEKLEIRHAVLCSEMGTHFSPCGRYLAACIACHPPPDMVVDNTPLGPVAPFYELRVYSMEQHSFGKILHARPVRAAHCLTSIQFSPTSDYLLLAYGRRHMHLLHTIVVDSETGSLLPIHTILEVYRVSDMQLVKVLPSAEDEVNVACFHPWAGGGIAYGTKEGKLRLLKHERGGLGKRDKSSIEHCIEDELLEGAVERDPALEYNVPMTLG